MVKRREDRLNFTTYLLYIIKLKINPEITPTKYNKIVIKIFSFKFLFTLNNTSNPTPAFTKSPEIIMLSVTTFSKYNLVSITEEAQFGINPISPASIGPKIKLLARIFEMLSSPIK